MQQIVSVTSQGQITIPSFIRKLLALNKYPKASVYVEGKRIIVEPVVDILSLGGVLRHKAIKNRSINKVMKMEKDAPLSLIEKKYRKI